MFGDGFCRLPKEITLGSSRVHKSGLLSMTLIFHTCISIPRGVFEKIRNGATDSVYDIIRYDNHHGNTQNLIGHAIECIQGIVGAGADNETYLHFSNHHTSHFFSGFMGLPAGQLLRNRQRNTVKTQFCPHQKHNLYYTSFCVVTQLG